MPTLFFYNLYAREYVQSNMAGYYSRNDGWKDDSDLQEKLTTSVNQGIQQLEILDFMKRDFDQYT